MLDMPVRLDLQGLLRNLRRQGTPDRTYFIELFLDWEVEEAICARYGLLEGLDPGDPYFKWRRRIALYRFLGYELVEFEIPQFVFPLDPGGVVDDTAPLRREGGRRWLTEGRGVIASWEDFERYPWPDSRTYDFSELDWLERNLPDDMGITSPCQGVFEKVQWLMGYEGLCYALYDNPELVQAVFRRVGELYAEAAEMLLQFDRLVALFGGEDMGFKTATMIPARVLIEQSFPWHARMARMAHERGKLYMIHSCGNLKEVMPALIEQVGIDARHSFEDAIEPVTEAKKRWGDRIAVLGGIDMDFLCRATEQQIRQRVRETLDVCMPGGGYCLGTGNTVANYVPLDNYLTMLDEGRKYSA